MESNKELDYMPVLAQAIITDILDRDERRAFDLAYFELQRRAWTPSTGVVTAFLHTAGFRVVYKDGSEKVLTIADLIY